MKNLLFLALIAQINLSAETSWSSPVAANDGSEIFSQSGGQSFIYLNDSGTALTLFPNKVMMEPQIFVTSSSNFGMNWQTPVQLNMNNSEHYSDAASGNLFISLNQQGRAIFSWLDINAAETMGTLKAALFDASGWMVTDLDMLNFPMNSSKGNTTSFIGNANNTAVVSWIKNTGGTNYDLKSSFNDGSVWTDHPIASITSDSTPSLFLSMSPSGDLLFASWIEATNPTKALKVSLYNFTSQTWEAPDTLSSSFDGSEDFSPIAVSDSGIAIAQWVEKISMKSLKTKIYKNGTWASETTRSTVSNMGSLNTRPFSINDEGHALLLWGEQQPSTSDVSLKFSSFDGSVWSPAKDILIDMGGSGISFSSILNNSELGLLVLSAGSNLKGGFLQSPSSDWVINDLDSSIQARQPFVNLNNQGTGLVTWFSDPTNMRQVSVKAAFFSSGAWTTLDVPGSTSLPNPTFALFPYSALNSEGNALLSWGQQGSTLFYTSTNTSSSGPTPPSEASGYQTFSQFDISTDLINVLSWQPSTTPNVSYRIYRNGMLVGTSYTPSYDDHQQAPGKVVNYSITAVNESGSQSAPILFTVAPLKQ